MGGEAIANYNMSFDNGNFIKGKTYKYRRSDKDPAFILVTIEREKEQELWHTEFDTLFTLKN